MADGYSSDLFSDTEKNDFLPDDGDGRVSPEIPIQKSFSIVPKWCFEEGLVKRPGAGSKSDSETSSEEDVPRKKRRVRSKGKGPSPNLEDAVYDIKALLQAVAKKVDRNERCLKELQESRLVCVNRKSG